MKQRLVVLGYRLSWLLVRWLPEPVAYALFRWAGDIAWRRRVRGVVRLEQNLARIVGRDTPPDQLADLSRRAMRSYMRYFCDAFRLPSWTPERVNSTLHVHCPGGLDGLRTLFDTDRGIVVALPHTGNWDHAGAFVVPFSGRHMTTVAERLHPAELFDMFIDYRTTLGMEVLPADGGASTFGTLARRLRERGLVCLVADRDLSRGGVEVEFFGETAKMPGGPAALALQTGAMLLPITLWYEPDGSHARVHPEITPPEEGDKAHKVAVMTQRLADVFAEGIAEHPADWHMLQPFWLADLDARAAAKAAAT